MSEHSAKAGCEGYEACIDDLTCKKKTDKIRTAKGEDEDKYRLTFPVQRAAGRVKGGRERGRREITSSFAAEPGGKRPALSRGGRDRYITCEGPGTDQDCTGKKSGTAERCALCLFEKETGRFSFAPGGETASAGRKTAEKQNMT